MLIKQSKLSSYELKKVITHFVIDINATKTSFLLNINRNTINRFYHSVRRRGRITVIFFRASFGFRYFFFLLIIIVIISN